jgi:hypothetical protein
MTGPNDLNGLNNLNGLMSSVASSAWNSGAKGRAASGA